MLVKFQVTYISQNTITVSNIIKFSENNYQITMSSLREKCPHSEFFWSVFSHIRTEHGKIRTRKTPTTDTFQAVVLKI